jgi:hypothetical protein
MIVTSNALFLSQTIAQPLAHARIGYQTYTRDAVTVTVSSETAAGPKDAPLRPDTVEFWEPAAMPATWEIDFGALRDIDYIGIAGHTIGASGAAIAAETSQDGTTWTAFAGDIAPGDDTAIMLLDELRSVRYVRLTLTGTTVPRLAVIYIGEALAMPRMIYGGHTPITLSRETVLHQSLSRGGQFLGQGFRRHGVTGSIAFQNLPASFVRQDFDLFTKSARRFPYFVAWRPSTFPKEVAYVWTDEDIRPSNMGKRDFMQVSWNMKGLGNV